MRNQLSSKDAGAGISTKYGDRNLYSCPHTYSILNGADNFQPAKPCRHLGENEECLAPESGRGGSGNAGYRGCDGLTVLDIGNFFVEVVRLVTNDINDFEAEFPGSRT